MKECDVRIVQDFYTAFGACRYGIEFCCLFIFFLPRNVVCLWVSLFICFVVCLSVCLLAVLDFVKEGDVKICQRWRVSNWRKSFQHFVEFVEGGRLALEFIIM